MLRYSYYPMYIGCGNRWGNVYSNLPISYDTIHSFKRWSRARSGTADYYKLVRWYNTIGKHTIMGPLWLYANDEELQNLKRYHLRIEKSNTNLPHTSQSAKYVCCPAEVNMHRTINLDHITKSEEPQQAFNKFCEEYKDIFSLPSGWYRSYKSTFYDIDTGEYPPITQKPYTLPLKHSQLDCEELEMLEKGWNYLKDYLSLI